MAVSAIIALIARRWSWTQRYTYENESADASKHRRGWHIAEGPFSLRRISEQ